MDAIDVLIKYWGHTQFRLKQKEIILTIDVGVGKSKATVYTCDLTHKYIEINADYRS